MARHSKLRSIRVPSESQFSLTRSAVVWTSWAAAAAMISSCWRTDARPASEPKRSRSSRRSRGIRRSSAPADLGVRGRGQKHARGRRRRRRARRRRRRRAARRRSASLAARIALEVGVGEARHGQLGGERVHRGDDRERVPRRAPVQRRHAREALRRGLHQAVLLEPAQRLPHRRPAQPEPRAQLLVAQPLPGRERPVDDRVPQRDVGPVAQQIALERRRVGGNWHLKYQYATTPDPVSCSPCAESTCTSICRPATGCAGASGTTRTRSSGTSGRGREPTSVEDLVALYERLDLVGVLLGWDAQGKELDNAEIARDLRAVERALRRLRVASTRTARTRWSGWRASRSWGCEGLKLHPTMQDVRPRRRPLPAVLRRGRGARPDPAHARRARAGSARASPAARACGSTSRGRSCSTASPPATRTCRSCSRTSAGRGTSRPSRWRCTSPTSTSTSRGWKYRYLPDEVQREIPRRLRGQFCFGTDYPMFDPEACLSELDRLELPPDVANAVLRDNAAALLGLPDRP